MADEGEHTSPEIAALLGVSRQLVSRVEGQAVAKLRTYFHTLPDDVLQEVLPLFRRMLLGGRDE